MPLSPALLHALTDLLGDKGCTTDADTMAPWLSDWRGRVHGRAAALLSPSSSQQVQAIVRLCAAHGARLTIQGGNSGQCAGATPDDNGDALLLSLRRMNKIRDIDRDARLLRADAGLILAHAHDAANHVGLRFPLTLGARGSATLGGLVSTNAGGTQVLRHGTMRALTAGVEVVLADGSLLDLMQPLAKDNQGPDPKHLFIGGEGVFGIVTGVALDLVPDVAARCVAWIAVADPATALDVLRTLEMEMGSALEGFELIPETALASVIAHVPGLRRPLDTQSPWHVLMEMVSADGDGPLADQVQSSLAALLDSGRISDAFLAQTGPQGDMLWRIRDSISEAERAKGPALQHDISVPVDAMPAYIDDVPRRVAAAYPGATSLAFGHLGDGNVHFHIRPPAGCDAGAWIREHGEGASLIAYSAAVALGGSISAEHGIGRSKRELFGTIGDPVRRSLVRALKSALDPSGLLNPGVLVPD